MTERREGCYEIPSLIMPPFLTDRRRYFKTHKTIHHKKLPLFHRPKKVSNLTTFKIGNKTYHCGTSREEDEWLKKLGVTARQQVIYGYNGKVMVVDGIDYTKRIVFEYLGSHCHSIRAYPREKWDIPTWMGKTPREMYLETINRFKFLKARSYKIFFVWDKDYKKGFMGRYFKGNGDNLY